MARVLVADDVEENRYLLVSLLQGHGFEVVTATNGAEALRLARDSPPDLVVTDILMPGMDGFELCRRWRQEESLRRIPIAVYTATFTDPADERLALDLGADLFLAKPQSPDVVLEALRALMLKGPVPRGPALDESAGPEPDELMRQHNEALLRKLEKKVRALEGEVAERKRLESELQASLGLLRTAGRIARIGGWSVDLRDQSVRWSEEVASILEVPLTERYTLEDTLGFYAEEGRARVREAFEACAREGIPHDLEAEVVTGRGRRLWVRSLAEARRDAAGAIVRVQGALQDITDRVRAESERRLLQEELFHSQKLESIGRLAAGVGHDINNMLAAISAYTDLAMDALGPEDPLRADLQEIALAGQRAAALVRQLLAFGRKQHLEEKVLDLNRVVRGIEGMLRRLVREDVALVLDLAQEPVRVLADAAQLEQVLVNLAVNASDAMASGGTLTLATRGAAERPPEPEGGPEGSRDRDVSLLVSDTGSGMDAATRERIFEPFFTTKEAGKGTGLGLSTVYGIVTQSGGRIQVESEPGQGTTFRILLPEAGTP